MKYGTLRAKLARKIQQLEGKQSGSFGMELVMEDGQLKGFNFIFEAKQEDSDETTETTGQETY